MDYLAEGGDTMIRHRSLVSVFLVTCLAALLAAGTCSAQMLRVTDIWRQVPPDSLLVVGFDQRPGSPTMQAIASSQDQQERELLAKQHEAWRKAVESLAMLFGISLDFARDIESWDGQQVCLVVLPEGKDGVQPVLMISSTDQAAASAALTKLLEPWQRVGEIIPQDDSDYPITAFRTKDKGFEVYASAYGSVVAISPSKDSLKQALKGGGFAAGSPGQKMLDALDGSLFYAYADVALLKRMGVKDFPVPVSAFGLGASAVETGTRIRAIGLLNEQGVAIATQMLGAQPAGVLTANPGVPSTSLAAASLPDISGLAKMMGMIGNPGENPHVDFLQALGGTQVSAAMTAVLPVPSGVASAMADSDQSAAEKMAKITQSLRQMKLLKKPVTEVSGIPAVPVEIPGLANACLAQVGKHVVLASDGQSLAQAAAAIRGGAAPISESSTYKETMEGLGNSNLATVYVSLAPVRGLGFLVEAIGLGQIQPVYGAIAKSLQELKALGIGAGIENDTVTATIFLRARPGVGAGAGAAAASITAVGAAVLFPVFATARQAARASECASNLKQLALAAVMYSQDYNGKLPSYKGWQKELGPYLRAELKCPTEDAIYAFNKNLGGVNLNKIANPSDVVIFFEASSELGNAWGSRADVMLPHEGQGWFAYADGHVVKLTEVPSQSHWVPKMTPSKPAPKAPAKRKK